MEISLDETDLAIITALQARPDDSNRAVAASVGMSDVGVANRINRLIENNVIRPTIFYDTDALELPLYCVFDIEVRGRTGADVADDIAEIKDLETVVRLAGSPDISILFFARDIDHIESCRRKVSVIKGVKSLSVMISSEVTKFMTSYGAYAMLQHKS